MSWSLAWLESHLLIGSTLVEGSTLTDEAAARVLAGRTISGHPVSEIRELLNYRAAVESIIGELALAPYLSVDLLLGFHRRLFAGFGVPAGSFKTHRNFTFRSDGSKHAYLAPSATGEAIGRWLQSFNEPWHRPPEEGAAHLYGEFQAIHPFDDGNGRIARVLLAYWLHWKARSAFPFYSKDKLEHLQAIEATDVGDYQPLIQFFRQRLRHE